MKTTPNMTDRPAYFQENLQKPGLLGWWYRAMAYHVPDGQKPTLRDQEIIRRSRLATFALVVQLLLVEGPVIPVVAASPNHTIVLPWLLGCIAALLAAFACNRRGKLTVAGLLMVASIEITIIVKLWTIPGGIGISDLPQFDILIQPVLLAVVLLPPWSAFATAGFNIAFILVTLFSGPRSPNLLAALHNPMQQDDILAVPVMAQLLSATVAFLIVTNLLAALKRARRAEQIAALEHAIAESQRALASRNQELETGVHALVQTIQSAASSHDGAYEHINLSLDNAFWPIIQQVWHFLDRYQRTRQAESQLAATVQASTELIDALGKSQQGQPFQIPPRRNTPVDGIVFALSSMGQLPRQEGQSGFFPHQPCPPGAPVKQASSERSKEPT